VRRTATRSTPRDPEQVKCPGSRWEQEGDAKGWTERATARSRGRASDFSKLLASSSVEGTLGAVEHTFLSRGRVQDGPTGRLCVTHGLPGGSVLSSPSYRMGAARCDSRQRGARVCDTGCPGRIGWGKSTEASGRSGGGRKRDRKARGPWPVKSRLMTPSREPSSYQRWHASA